MANIPRLAVRGLFEVQWREKDDAIEIEGAVVEPLPNAMFRVKLDNEHEASAHVSGKMPMFCIRILSGDWARMEVSPYDLSRGRITYRYK